MLNFSFMQRALLAGLLIGVICPAVGVFLVVRRCSFMADTLAHVSLAGVAMGIILNLPVSLCIMVFAAIVALCVERLRSGEKLYGDAVLAMVMSSGLALAVVLISFARGYNIDLMSYLFGSILSVSTADIRLVFCLGIIVLGTIGFLYKELCYISFDEDSARASGLPVGLLNVVFAILVAVAVSLSIRVVGALLVSALMVIPVIAALVISGSFRQVFWISIVFGVFSTLAGLIVSFYAGTASGGTIVLLAAGLFASIFVGRKMIRRLSLTGFYQVGVRRGRLGVRK